MTPDDLERTLGRNVRAVRIAQRVTQLELAESANVSLGALKHLESGSGSTTTTLVKVLQALDKASWLDTLGPAPEAFNPLSLLEAREREARRPKGPPRVRRRSAS